MGGSKQQLTSLQALHSNFTMVEENFEMLLSETAQNDFTDFCRNHTFTMVEEIFVIWLSETTQNGLILLFSVVVVVISSPWLKKILKFEFLKYSRLA